MSLLNEHELGDTEARKDEPCCAVLDLVEQEWGFWVCGTGSGGVR